MEAASRSQSQASSWFFGRRVFAVSVLPALAAGLVLRLWMLRDLFAATGDSLVYGDIAKNLLLHGRYALSAVNGEPHSTLIRLPGYPLFLALCFRLFGMENYFSAVLIQIALELAGCLLLADFTGRIVPARMRTGSAHATLWLAALCPFTAVYAATPLTEAPTLFAIALALWALARFRERAGWGSALAFTFAVAWAALLRPDGALVGLALAPAMFCGWKRAEADGALAGKKLLRMAAVCLLLALAPFAAWTARNWQVFHVFQPLAPQSATDPGQETDPGWQRWVKTWCLDYVSTYEIYWNVPGDTLDLSELPGRAFDSPAQYAETAALAWKYNRRDHAQAIRPDVDAGFAKLASERIAAHPLRYYLWLPLGRVADMWLRPRVENLNIDLDWWVYAHHNDETLFSWFYAGLNALYLLLALAGFCFSPRFSTPRMKTYPWGPRFSTPRMKTYPWGPRFWPYMLAYFLLRSVALMASVTAPEARYTLECFPMLFVLGGIALYWVTYWVLLSVLKVKASLGSA